MALAAMCAATPAYAQEALPDANGEVKDFRLDNPQPKEQAPAPLPKAEPPVVQPKIDAVPARETVTAPATKAPAKRDEEARRSAVKAADEQGSVPQEPAATSAIPQQQPTTENVTAPLVEERAVPQAGLAVDYQSYWPLLAALLAALFIGALIWFWKRRATNKAEDMSYVAVETTDSVPTKPLSPTPIAASPAPASGVLTTQFDPESARLSIANLTVTGRLQLRYDGDLPLENVQLRTLMISVSDEQKALINQFHSDANMGQVNSLGSVKPGEEIKMKLELQLPRDALQAFDWRERRFVAPIVLINIASEGHAIEPVHITSLVGQQSGPESSRLQPLPIDRGPKLFDALQFRPIAA